MNIISSIATIAAFLLLIVVLSRKDMVKSVYFPFLLLAVLFYLLGNHIVAAQGICPERPRI